VTQESELSAMEVWQSDHRLEIQVVQDYQSEHPSVVSSLRLDNDPPRKIRVLMWRDEGDHHATAIHRLCHDPDALVFEAARHSPDELATIIAEIRSLASTSSPGSFQMYGIGWDAVTVHVRADLETLAADLHRRFGDAIILTVGLFPYPLDRPLSWSERMTAVRPFVERPEAIDLPGLEAHLEPPFLQINIGARVDATIELINVSATHIQMSAGAATVSLVDPNSGVTVGGFHGAVAASARVITLDPGQRAEIPALVGTTSFQRDLGYVVPPGRYVARARVPVSIGSGPESTHVILRVPDGEALVVE
jgi:hypothetical protein